MGVPLASSFTYASGATPAASCLSGICSQTFRHLAIRLVVSSAPSAVEMRIICPLLCLMTPTKSLARSTWYGILLPVQSREKPVVGFLAGDAFSADLSPFQRDMFAGSLRVHALGGPACQSEAIGLSRQ